MGKITILPDTLCNQIAAGEVVERPAAVVKELIENSIDALSRRITLAVTQGGRKEIRVVDNGAGMHPDDALLALERHATSKIRKLEDLQTIHSLGFRGEALPSIAAVSRFEMTTREADTVSGTCIHVEGGVIRDVREAGCAPGTMITVRDLFFNVPARRKFLRSIDTEASYISDQFLRLAIAHHGIHFQLIHQERTLYDFPQAPSAEQRAVQVLGPDTGKKLIPFSAQNGPMRVHGFTGRPDLQRANSQSLFICVNGRPVWDRLINRAVLSAYESLIPQGKFPAAVIFFELSPDLVDVNVHPTKREVRFKNPGDVIETVRNAIRQSIEGSRPLFAPSSAFRTSSRSEFVPASREQMIREDQLSFDRIHRHPLPTGDPPPQVHVSGFADVDRPEPLHQDASSPPQPAADGEIPFAQLPVIGQLANSYILLEAGDGLVIIDQHAAHERIIFDSLSLPNPREGAQRLMRSTVLELLPRDAARLRRWLPFLKETGIEIESFGGESFVIHAVPAALSDCPPDELVRDLVASAIEEDAAPRWNIASRLARTAACHRAVRAGQRLKPEEIRQLLQDLDRTRFSSTCPHGRPVWYKLSHNDIAKFFHRT